MNAGMGIIHSERPPHDIHEIGGKQEIIQLWINTPAKNKMDQPFYFPIQANEVPSVTSADGLITMNVFAGKLNGVMGKIPTQSPINAATIIAQKGGKITIDIPSTHNALLYLLDGEISLGGYGMVEELNAVVFKQDGDGFSIEAKKNTRMLLVTGEPLNEKMVSYGPFVMNTQTQIMEAMRDYQMGKMGVLIEE
jgi:redox-sensitive bicupin YhaK (pirin superfamily)